MSLRLPAAVPVDELCQVSCLLCVTCNELVLQELFGCWSLHRQNGSRRMKYNDNVTTGAAGRRRTQYSDLVLIQHVRSQVYHRNAGV